MQGLVKVVQSYLLHPCCLHVVFFLIINFGTDWFLLTTMNLILQVLWHVELHSPFSQKTWQSLEDDHRKNAWMTRVKGWRKKVPPPPYSRHSSSVACSAFICWALPWNNGKFWGDSGALESNRFFFKTLCNMKREAEGAVLWRKLVLSWKVGPCNTCWCGSVVLIMFHFHLRQWKFRFKFQINCTFFNRTTVLV